MNQQRSRRFRAAEDAKQKETEKEEFMKLLKQQNKADPALNTLESVTKKAFDSNLITPGTPFMDILAASLRYWCAYKLNTDPAWAKMKVIISDATIPGEGEHKIMNFIRSQRSSPDHDPNTKHVIYGLDADLIMLGLATHEPHFRVLREDVFFQDSKAKMCKLCGQKGHDARSCRGEAKEKDDENQETHMSAALVPKPFIWLHVSILREYLAVELDVPGLPFRFDLERAIDDWVFMCFFVGNDFLPHLPALEIRENGIDTLMAIWRENLPRMGGYLTKDGHVDLDRAQLILNGLARQEDGIFKRRKAVEDRREANAKRRKTEGNGNNDSRYRPRQAPPEHPEAGLALYPVSNFPREAPKAISHDMVVNRGAVAGANVANVANKSAASVLRSQIQSLMSDGSESTSQTPSKDEVDAVESHIQAPKPAIGKRKASLMEEESSTPGTDTPHTNGQAAAQVDGPVDNVRLWEKGYAERYYQQKFGVDPSDKEFRHHVGRAYVEGLAWVLMYYSQGCPSWEWYYPYHYAPFAADFVDLGKMRISFEKGRTSKPFEQLMSVLPAASRQAIPEIFHDLMTDKESEIIDFYPEHFEVDLNGKKMAWQGVALLPFIDMPRLLAAVEKRYALLSPEDAARNSVGQDVLLISDAHPGLYGEILEKFYSKKRGATEYELNPRTADGLAGKVWMIPGYLPHGALDYPLERKQMPDVDHDRSLR
jgi:5'-3' exoribonuclease 2